MWLLHYDDAVFELGSPVSGYMILVSKRHLKSTKNSISLAIVTTRSKTVNQDLTK